MDVEKVDWDQRYQRKETPWDSGAPSAELQRVLTEWAVPPSRCLEIGCGTGTNAIFLAQQGFDVTATDLSTTAILQAESKANEAGVAVQFLAANILGNPKLEGQFPFVFDRGVYHVLRKVDLEGYRELLRRVTVSGSLYLTLAGNANDPMPEDHGPPRVKCEEIVTDLEPYFEVVQLREFHFDGVLIEGVPVQPLAWSALFRRTE